MEYYKQVYINKFNNLDEMGQFLKNITHENSCKIKTQTLNTYIFTKEIKLSKPSHKENCRPR